MVKWFAKANDDVLSHCRCTVALAATTGQLDCPWCGCGWLISCMECRKAFTFAKIVEVDFTYEQLLADDWRKRGHQSDPPDASGFAAWLERALARFPVGATIVYLDGDYFSPDETDIAFEGLYAHHKFDRLPHAIALSQPSYLDDTLGDSAYWLERERPDRNDDA